MKKHLQAVTLILSLILICWSNRHDLLFYRECQIRLMSESFERNSYCITYEPDEWTKLSKDTNCFLYAMNMKNHFNKYVVGSFGNFHDLIAENNISLDKAISLQREKLDTIGIQYKISSLDEQVPEGYYKVAFYISKKDYHWIRQDDNGTWSHKRGWFLRPTNRDIDGNIIYNPETANLGISDLLYHEFLLIKKS